MMTSLKGLIYLATLALLAIVFHAALGSDAVGDSATTHAITVDANGDDTASIPDFDGDGTIGFGDFLIFAGVFGSSESDEKYEAKYDLNGDGEIGFSDFVIFAQNFGRDAPSPVVAIPDANLRVAIEAALDKATGAPITQAEMATLDSLEANDADISDLTGLEFAVNLTYLSLNDNEITDISALSGLTNLTRLSLGRNNITDIAALSRLTNLTMLILKSNQLSDLAPLAANKGLGRGVTVDVTDNPLNAASESTHIPALQTRGVSVSFAPSPAVVIPDANLRAAIEAALSKGSGAPITVAEMTTLTYLEAISEDISDLTGLAYATNLISLYLFTNDITDISALSGLTNLISLGLSGNDITDISALSGLTNLRDLGLASNDITDISALSGLTNLDWWLGLDNNDITDISALSGLTNLTVLRLDFNDIRDISVLVGLTRLTTLDIRGNPLSDSSINDHIPALKSSAVTVLYDFFRVVGDFDIELVLLSSFTERQKEELQYAVRRWMAVITKDLPDYTFTQNWSGQCGGQSYAIPSGERIDDLRIYVSQEEFNNIAGYGSPTVLREETHLPVFGCMVFNSEAKHVQYVALHEIGHVLGVGTIWDNLGFLQDYPNADAHFNGPLAIAAFDDASGRGYTGKKVPVSQDGGHWRSSVFGTREVMISGDGALSTITVQSLADLGYGVDVAQADPYTLPGATQASAKIALAQPSVTVPGFDIAWAYPDVLPGAERYGQGRIVSNLPSIVGDDGQTGRLQSAERVWGLGMNFNFADERRMWGAAPPASAEPELTCGAALINEPIYVIDPQGRVVSTIRQ